MFHERQFPKFGTDFHIKVGHNALNSLLSDSIPPLKGASLIPDRGDSGLPYSGNQRGWDGRIRFIDVRDRKVVSRYRLFELLTIKMSFDAFNLCTS